MIRLPGVLTVALASACALQPAERSSSLPLEVGVPEGSGPPATYTATVVAPNDCPPGQIRVEMAWRDSPHYNPNIVFFVMPRPYRVCADISGLRDVPRPKDKLRLTFAKGKYAAVEVVVPTSTTPALPLRRPPTNAPRQ